MEPVDAALVVFSQGLAPNAQLALGRASRWRGALLVTAVGDEPTGEFRDLDAERKRETVERLEAAGIGVLRYPEESEYGVLLRVIGPACGYVAAWQLAHAVSGGRLAAPPHALAAAVANAQASSLTRLSSHMRPTGEFPQLALLGAGEVLPLVENLPRKLQEGLFVPQPALWDWLELAHGPFQQLCGRPAVLFGLLRADRPHDRNLARRAQAMLDPDLHELVLVPATVSGPLAVLEYEAMLNAIVLDAIADLAIDQGNWPGKGRDGSLYAIGSTADLIAPIPDAPVASLRRLEEATWPELERALASGARRAVLPLGATEQHGPHLPFTTDTQIARILGQRLCERLGDAIALPVIPVGCSPEHLEFPGTLSFERDTLARILDDIAASLRRHGFSELIVFSAHGGNAELLRDWGASRAHRFAPLRVSALSDLAGQTAALHAAAARLEIDAAAAGHHAGELETSIMQSIAPGAIRTSLAASGLLEVGCDPQRVFYPSLRANAASGVVGDASATSALRGEAYLTAWVDWLAAEVDAAKNRQ